MQNKIPRNIDKEFLLTRFPRYIPILDKIALSSKIQFGIINNHKIPVKLYMYNQYKLFINHIEFIPIRIHPIIISLWYFFLIVIYVG